jgi:hypothetical protein
MKGVELCGWVRYAVQIEWLSHREAARRLRHYQPGGGTMSALQMHGAVLASWATVRILPQELAVT